METESQLELCLSQTEALKWNGHQHQQVRFLPGTLLLVYVYTLSFKCMLEIFVMFH